MIKPEELRIGNLLLYNGEVDKVTAIDLDLDDENVPLVSFSDSNPVELNYGKVQLIPLTPEILEKCGFEKGLNEWYSKKYFTDLKELPEVMEIQINAKTFRCGFADADFGGTNAMTGKIVKYLHQLQNLYFALTGEELIYTP